MRYTIFRHELVKAVLDAPGETQSDLRRAVFDRVRVPTGLASYVDKVALHPYSVTDEDIAALQRFGHSDDSLFEITVAAALGAALYRLERGLAALRGEEPD